ncbi:MAG: YdcH family protein [Hyphomicrobiaceae bacterium]|nr:YdcH family protein [Hyphomicrobiaceae bacterium]MCC0008795.1 YdcH family protein [Hyphomicrobiaceae bacterium]
MSHVPHEIPEEFPEFKDKIHDLKVSNAHFARLFDEYHQINREVHRIEAAGVNTSDEEFENLKLVRLRLKDEIYHMLHE